MKQALILILLLASSVTAHGEIYEYEVIVENNVSATGVVYSEPGSPSVNGTLVVDGKERQVAGYWSGLGMADVYDENKNLYLLEVQ